MGPGSGIAALWKPVVSIEDKSKVVLISFGIVRLQAISWTDANQDRWRHLATPEQH